MGATEPRRFLVIDDTADILDLFRDILTDEGYQVTTDTFPLNPTATLAELKADRPDLIVLDLIIGGEPLGLQVLQLLTMERATATIPIVLGTAAHRQAAEMETHLRELGVATVLKPFNIEVLLAEIATALGQQTA